MRFITGPELFFARTGFVFTVLKISMQNNASFLKSFKLLISLVRERIRLHDNAGGYKAVLSGKRLFWSINIPGWPSEAFDQFIRNEFLRINKPETSTLQTIIFAITNRCPLRCIHCYESENIRDRETLTPDNLKTIMDQVIKCDIRHIQFSGGEPLCRFDDMIELMHQGGRKRDYWINTSGFGLTPDLALKMKEQGMTGAIISLDDWDEDRHNYIRQNTESYRWALKAAENCSNAGLIVCFSVCAHRQMVSEDNLSKIHLLAKKSGAAFLRILEPRKTGKYKGKDVALGPEQIELIHRFMRERNSGRKYRSYPIIQFPAFHSRKYGCLGAGNRYLYIDPDGNYNPCPFCRSKAGNALRNTLPEGIALTRRSGCHAFRQRSLTDYQ